MKLPAPPCNLPDDAFEADEAIAHSFIKYLVGTVALNRPPRHPKP
ncbi:hypothetical protein [Cerasicoccus maritimus]|nr:hypothetical protein [Cerasicoccus maritimus]